ncbi:hypothetical protein TNCV_2731711 [Trichonephila clavipes]|nr:hypothetical protein TNCV_2731711 [Trichonephila clavipes]
MPSTSSSMSTVSTSSSSSQAHLLSSSCATMPTVQGESLLPMPIPTATTASPSNNLNTSASSLLMKYPQFLQLLINLPPCQKKSNHPFLCQSLQLLLPMMHILTHHKFQSN